MAGNQQQKPQMIVQEGGRKKKRELPKLLRFLLYGSFTWSCVGAVCYASGFWTHRGDTLDDIISWSVGLGGGLTILLLYISFHIYEMD